MVFETPNQIEAEMTKDEVESITLKESGYSRN